MAESFTVVLSCGTDNPNRATRAFMLAMVAHKEGKDVTVFLLDEAVYLARKGVADHLTAATGDAADDHISYLQEFNVPIVVCTPCAISRGIQETDLIAGARMGTAPELVKLLSAGPSLSL